MQQKILKIIGAAAIIAYFLAIIVEFYFPNFVAAYFDPAIFLLIFLVIFTTLIIWQIKSVNKLPWHKIDSRLKISENKST